MTGLEISVQFRTGFPWNGKHQKKSRLVHLPIARAKHSDSITRCTRAERKMSGSSLASVFQRVKRPTPGLSGAQPAAHTYSIRPLIGLHVARTVPAECPTFHSMPTPTGNNFPTPPPPTSPPNITFLPAASSPADSRET